MNDQLHPAAVVEEPLSDHSALRGNHAKHAFALYEVCHQLTGGFSRHAGLLHNPPLGFRRVVQAFVYGVTQIGHLL